MKQSDASVLPSPILYCRVNMMLCNTQRYKRGFFFSFGSSTADTSLLQLNKHQISVPFFVCCEEILTNVLKFSLWPNKMTAYLLDQWFLNFPASDPQNKNQRSLLQLLGKHTHFITAGYKLVLSQFIDPFIYFQVPFLKRSCTTFLICICFLIVIFCMWIHFRKGTSSFS